MASILYKNARLFIADADLSTAIKELTVDYGAEMLDATVMGLTTRAKVGGLKTTKISGTALFKTDLLPLKSVENILFNYNGSDDLLFTVFADGVTEGSLTDRGFSMKGSLSEFSIGGVVGNLLEVKFAVEHSGD